jgi:hypothetical protein
LCADVATQFIPTAPLSFLQPRVPFPCTHTRSCVDWCLASAWNADARSTSRSLAGSHSFLGLACRRFAARVPDARAFYLLGALCSWGVPGPGPNAGAPMWTPGIVRAFCESRACICAAARGPVSAPRPVPVRALASVDRFPFACRCWLLLGRHCPPLLPSRPRFLRSFYYVPTTKAPLGRLRVRSTMLLRWMDGCVVFLSSLYPSISWICFF